MGSHQTDYIVCVTLTKRYICWRENTFNNHIYAHKSTSRLNYVNFKYLCVRVYGYRDKRGGLDDVFVWSKQSQRITSILNPHYIMTPKPYHVYYHNIVKAEGMVHVNNRVIGSCVVCSTFSVPTNRIEHSFMLSRFSQYFSLMLWMVVVTMIFIVYFVLTALQHLVLWIFMPFKIMSSNMNV